MTRLEQMRPWLLWLALIRILVGVAAIPLAPLLFRDHFLILVLLRPTKEVLLAGGWLLRQGEVALPGLVAATIPLSVVAVWLFFALGWAYAPLLREGKMPGLARRALRPEGVAAAQDALARNGPKLVPIARLATFSSATVGAAAGAAGMHPRVFVPADLAGAAASHALSIGSGYVLGNAYATAGPWLAGVGLLSAVVVVLLLARYLRRA